MLAKMWKKVLLAVCIVACLFNIMSKIVNRHSLEVNLESVNDGSVVFDFSKDDEKATNPDIIEGVVNQEVTQNTNNVDSSVTIEPVTNTAVENTVVADTNTTTDSAVVNEVTNETTTENKDGSTVVSYSEGLFNKVLDFMGLQKK
ncbi:MAG: hypothetical protein IKJ36_07205 [Clostridia bacterium]|nr:hypothetical protein [Clostridia bacterium]